MIEFRSVSKVYPGGVPAVDGVSFEVAEGTITCLIGTSGCGKTTSLKMINRLIEPSSGEIRVGGWSVREKDPIELRRSIGYVIQKGGLLPHLTALRNVLLPEEARGGPSAGARERARGLLELVGLEPAKYGHRYPAELSGGEQQRVGIARALMTDPPILLMDEPFGALDPITRARLRSEFAGIHRKLRKTIVLVTHDLADAFGLGEQIILMRAGRVVQKGGVEDFRRRPVDEFASEFLLQ